MWYTKCVMCEKISKIIKIMVYSLFKFAIFIIVGTFNMNNHCTVTFALDSQKSNFTNLIVFVRFSDEDDYLQDTCFENQTIKQITNNNYLTADYNVKDYFYNVSNGKINMQSLYLLDDEGVSIKLSKPRSYYVKKSEYNPSGYEESQRAERMLELKQDWSNSINSIIQSGYSLANIDNSGSFSLSELDKNGDNLIDSLTIIFNYSSEYSVNGSTDVLWNYQDFYNGVEIESNGKTITSGNYVQITANYNQLYKDKNGILFSNLQTMIHEMGHVFGLKDLYKRDLSSPVYFMSAMAKAISPVPQFISAKEREVKGWLGEDNVKQIEEVGMYTIKATSGLESNNVVCYKLNIPSLNKTLYLEYRKFDGSDNKYDTKDKTFTNSSGEIVSVDNKLKSGLVCFLFSNGMKYPDNYSISSGNYEVFGGGQTKNDSALSVGESYNISTGLKIEVQSIDNDSLVFEVIGTDIEHIHTTSHIPAQKATCSQTGNDEYWKCSVCGKCFDDENLIYEKNESEFIISKKAHTKQWVNEVPATCKNEGLTAGEKCEICGEVISGCDVIPQKEHRASDWIIDKESTATECGEKHKECLDCGDVLETLSIGIKQEETKKDDEISSDNENDNFDSENKKEDEIDVVESEMNEEHPSKKILRVMIILFVTASCLIGAGSFFVLKKKRKRN